MLTVIGPLLKFEFRQSIIRGEPSIVMIVADVQRTDACRWRECAGRFEVAAALRRLADRIEAQK